MNEYTITDEVKPVNFGATRVEEVLQNVSMIIATVVFSCPLARDFAWSPDVDAPINVAPARITASLFQAIREYEPRAEVVSVTYQGDPLNGKLKPVVRVRIDESTL